MYQVSFFECLIWLDLGLNPGFPGYWWTFYPLGYICVCVCVCGGCCGWQGTRWHASSLLFSTVGLVMSLSLTTFGLWFSMKEITLFFFFTYSNYCLHFHRSTHNVPANMSFDLLQVFHVTLGNLLRTSNWTLYLIPGGGRLIRQARDTVDKALTWKVLLSEIIWGGVAGSIPTAGKNNKDYLQ